MVVIILIITLIIFFICLVFFRKKVLVEHYGYDKWQWELHNMNFDKPWKNIETGYNDPYPQDIPLPSANDKNFPEYIQEIVNENKINEILNQLLYKDRPLANKTKKYNFRYVDITSLELYKINKDTWYNRLDDFNIYNKCNWEYNQTGRNISCLSPSLKFKTPKSCIPDVNKVVKYFLRKFNEVDKKIKKNKPHNAYDIYKFKIHHIKQTRTKPKLYQDSPCITDYGIIMVLYRDGDYVGITIYMEIIDLGDKFVFKYFDIVGYYNTDKLFLPNGFREVGSYKFYEINPLFRLKEGEKNINYYNVEKEWVDHQQYYLDNTLKYQYTCFNTQPQFYDPSDIPPTNPAAKSQPILKYVYNKTNCESGFDQFGRVKAKGLWDRPCQSDIECPYYQANKNYSNRFGKCNKLYGFCELPKGMKHLGFHSYYPYKCEIDLKAQSKVPICNPPGFRPAPLCYNCKSVNKINRWQPVTKLDNCCDDQKDKGKYPYLDGPDYAFAGDVNARLWAHK